LKRAISAINYQVDEELEADAEDGLGAEADD
jgi:hypothetical protein